MLVTLAIAFGLSGNSWYSPRAFAGIMAVIANLLIFWIEFNEVDHPLVRSIAAAFAVACAVAIVVALFS